MSSDGQAQQQRGRQISPDEVDDFDELLAEALDDFENPNLLTGAITRDQQQKGGSAQQQQAGAAAAASSESSAGLRENASTADLLKPLAGLSLDGLRRGAGEGSTGDEGEENVDFDQLMGRLESEFGSLDKAVKDLLEPSEDDENDPEVRTLKEQLRSLTSKVDSADPAELGEALASTLRCLDESVAAHNRHADAVHLPKPGGDQRAAAGAAAAGTAASGASAGAAAGEATGSGLGAAGASQEMLMPFMENMMHTLLSKEVIYPSLKAIRDGYPGWLEANGPGLSSAELETNRQRAAIVGQVCQQYESLGDAKPSEAEFDRILRLVQRMQELGPPPEELLGDKDLPSVMPQCPQM
uniref:Peroxin-19 n=1 Tax=Macrostomum lignano TaxID=282301 RepID=A0A1I8HSB6_9PLAT